MARNIHTLIFTVLFTVDCIFQIKAVELHRQAFIQTDNELRYLVDGISLHLHDSLTSDGEFAIPNTNEMAAAQPYSSPIVLFPAVLDFKENPIGIPRLARVVVSNPNYHINVFLLSISGTSVNFHCSFFQDKVISPGGNTTFDVVFLSRHEGPVHNTLYIHTSVGSFKYQVEGIGTPNPYRLRPFLGAKVPVNSIYSPVINMYNPHSSTLQITEMYSSGGDLHLELPTGEKEAKQQLWEIAPYETKPIMKANFLAREANNHTAYIRIKTNTTSNDYLVLPVEVEVSSASGIYSTTDSLDFGVMYSKDAPKSLVLSLLNHSQKPVLITSVSVSPFNKAVTVNFQPVKILPNTGVAVQVAAVTFNPNLAVDSNSCSGNIIVRTKSSQFKIAIKYHASVLQGSLLYNSSDFEFYVGDSVKRGGLQKNITLKNSFNVSVAIFDAVLSDGAANYFKVVLNNAVVIHPEQTVTIGYVTLRTCSDIAILQNAFLKLRTNISDFEIPLLCYNGKLTPFVPLAKNMSASRLDVGTLSVGEKRDVLIAVINSNPVNVQLRRFGGTLIHIIVELLAVHNKNISELMDTRSFNGMTKTLDLAPSHFAIFRVGVSAPNTEDYFQGEVFIETAFETLKIPITFRTAVGGLSVVSSYLAFQSTFPGKIVTAQLYVQSSFSTPMTVTSVTTLRDDIRFTYVPLKESSVIQPNAKTMVGWLQFDIRKDCDKFCYLGFDADTPIGHRWLSSFKLQYGIASVDVDLHQSLWSKWANISNRKRIEQNVTFVLDTTEVHGFLFQSVVSLVWPKLSAKSKLIFPLTQIGNQTVEELVLENTANVPVIVQVIPLCAYPHPSAVVNTLQRSGIEGLPSVLAYNETVFRLSTNQSYNHRMLPVFLQETSIHPESVVLLIKPGEKVRVPVLFTPISEKEVSTLLLIRNNLTVLEVVHLQGAGANCDIRFGSRAPGSSTPLLFELTEKHLKDCENSPFPQYALPNFAVRRAFTVRNTGLLPIYISGFGISSSLCEGYGFRVLNCHGFYLSPNSSKKIDIAFTPDFTLARVQRELVIHTSMGSGGETLKFILVATIPPYLLSRCASILPRPQWEIMLYYVTVCLMCFVLFCVLVTAYLESDRIIRCTFVAMTVTAIPDVNKASIPLDLEPFDLKRVAAKGLSSGGVRSHLDQPSISNNNNNNKENCRGKKSGNSNRFTSSCDSLNILKSGNLHSFLRRVSGDGSNKEVEKKSKEVVKLKKLVKSKSLSDPMESNNNNLTAQSGNSSKLNKRNRKYSSENNDYVAAAANDDKSSSCSSVSENDKLSVLPLKTKEAVCTARCSQQKRRSPNTNNPQDSTVTRLKPVATRKSVGDVTEEDTSSTTTESSSPDFDSSEKEPRRDESTRWFVKENRNSSITSTKVDDADDEGANDTGCGKWTRRTSEHRHVQRTRMSSPVVELPYKLNTNARTSSNSKAWLCWGEENEEKLNKLKSLKKYENSESFKKPVNDGESSSTGKDSPPPLWDRTTVISNIDDAYEAIAKTTESWDSRRKKGFLNFEKHSGIKKKNYHEKQFSLDKEESAELGSVKALPQFNRIQSVPKKLAKDVKQSRAIGAVGQRPSMTLTLPVAAEHWNRFDAESASPITGTPLTPTDHQSCYSSQSMMDYGQVNRQQTSSAPGFEYQWRTPSTQMPLNSLLDLRTRERANESSDWSAFGSGSSYFTSNNLWNSEIDSGNVWSPLKDYSVNNDVNAGSFDVGIWNNPSLDTLNPIGWPSVSKWSDSPISSNSNNLLNLPQVNDRQDPPVTASEYHPFNSLPNIWTPPNSTGTVRNDDWQNSLFHSPTSSHSSENKH
ncbi:hypothetical protein CHUAL_008681 [Chamberlinius hualienensis]